MADLQQELQRASALAQLDDVIDRSERRELDQWPANDRLWFLSLLKPFARDRANECRLTPRATYATPNYVKHVVLELVVREADGDQQRLSEKVRELGQLYCKLGGKAPSFDESDTAAVLKIATLLRRRLLDQPAQKQQRGVVPDRLL